MVLVVVAPAIFILAEQGTKLEAALGLSCSSSFCSCSVVRFLYQSVSVLFFSSFQTN